jgi:hypothetical protein
MAVEGSLELFKLPEILQMISQQRKTGILTVQGQNDIVAISFHQGDIVAADALNQTQEEGLAEVLVGDGLLSQAQFSRAVSEQQSSGVRLLDLLVDHGYLKREQLLQALRRQVERLLQHLLVWQKGDFKFYGGEEVSFEEGFRPISVEELLLHSLQATEGEVASAEPLPAAASAAAPARPRAVPAEPPPPAAPSVPARPSAVAPAAAAPGTSAVRPVAPVVAFPSPTAPPEAFRKMKVEALPVVPAARVAAARWMALALGGLVAAVAFLAPNHIVLPFPWQEGERAALAAEQRSALYLKIDRAAKTFFLLEGRFPDQLDELRAAGLLSSADLRDPLGESLQYEVREDSYTLRPVRGGEPVPGAETTEAITGNFLLDPEFLSVPTDTETAPLVLLD